MQNNKIKYGQYYASDEIEELDLTNIYKIEESACASSSIKHIEGIARNLGNFAFSVCEHLEGEIHVGGKRVGRAAFERCPLINKVVLEPGVEEIDGWAFDECESLTQLQLPQTLRTIGEEAFHKIGIKTLSIGEVDEIAARAFSECSELETVNIEKINKSIKSNSFSKCPNLKNITYNGLSIMNLAKNERFKEIVELDGAFYIEYEEEFLDENGKSTTISHKTLIESDIPLVYGHEELKEAPTSFDDIPIERMQEVPEGIRRECKFLTGVILDGVEEIGNNAFDKCSMLRNVELSSNLRKIGKCAFQDSGIEAIDLSKTRCNSY